MEKSIRNMDESHTSSRASVNCRATLWLANEAAVLDEHIRNVSTCHAELGLSACEL
jgi:hypothetical protein